MGMIVIASDYKMIMAIVEKYSTAPDQKTCTHCFCRLATNGQKYCCKCGMQQTTACFGCVKCLK